MPASPTIERPVARIHKPFGSRLHAALAGRLAALGVLFATELLVITLALDGEALRQSSGLAQFVFSSGSWTLKALVAFAILFAIFEGLRAGPALRSTLLAPVDAPPSLAFLAAHIAAIGAFAALSNALFFHTPSGAAPDIVTLLWFAAGSAAIAFAALAALPSAVWRELARGSARSAAIAAIAATAACLAGDALRSLWYPLSQLTYALTRQMLRPFLSTIVADPATMILGSPGFNVEIAPQCSGFEGAGLMLVFTLCWLVLFRREFRFPHALVLVPAAVAAAYLLNAARIAALILIGNAGAEQIALGGFHSQAGWIAFNGLAVAFAIGARRVAWVTASTAPVPARISVRSADATPAYLLPLLAILAATMLTRAVSAGFDWLYPVRFLAALAVLWTFRAAYRSLDWRFGWQAFATGAAVFALWIALAGLTPSPGNAAFAAGLASAPPVPRIAWLLLRALAACTTVPIAEELAFRGFLLRRFTAADFEAVDPRRFSWPALAASSLIFGALHGGLWFAGALAGAAYAFAFRRRGRIGDAVAAHASTNLLLAVWVMTRGDWRLW